MNTIENSVYYHSPIETLKITENGKAITSVRWDLTHKDAVHNDPLTPLLQEAVKEFQEYFNGTRKIFDLPIDPKGTTFQCRVWEAVSAIPYGNTRSYGTIAEQAGNPKGSRAVGMANNKNPIVIIVPCHRVVGHDGKLVGYAAGITIKQQLLELEKRYR
jgi:methylated-DNA-[protein]-cysteine S-methyltransferase